MQIIKRIASCKLLITPNTDGKIEDVFPCSGKVELIRVIFKKPFSTFVFIKIGILKIDSIEPSFTNSDPSSPYFGKVRDYFISPAFSTKEKFIMETACEIEKVELFLFNKVISDKEECFRGFIRANHLSAEWGKWVSEWKFNKLKNY